VLASSGQQILVTDADLPTPIEELESLQREMRSGASAAIGSRARLGIERADVRQHPTRALLGRLANGVIRALAVPGIHDTQCGFKLFDGTKARATFTAARIDGWGFDIEILRRFCRQGWQISEVPVSWEHQQGSKLRPVDYLITLGELIRIRFSEHRWG